MKRAAVRLLGTLACAARAQLYGFSEREPLLEFSATQAAGCLTSAVSPEQYAFCTIQGSR